MGKGYKIAPLLLGLLPVVAWGQPVTTGQPGAGQNGPMLERLGVGQPTASDGGTVRVTGPTPVAEADDVANQVAAADTVDGLLLVVTIDGADVRLDDATPARVPRPRANREPFGEGGSVTATATAGGQTVGRAEVPDNVLAASEGDGLVRLTRRQIAIPIPLEGAADRVEITAPMTGARGSVDVRAAYEIWCRGDPRGKWCPR